MTKSCKYYFRLHFINRLVNTKTVKSAWPCNFISSLVTQPFLLINLMFPEIILIRTILIFYILVKPQSSILRAFTNTFISYI